MLKTEDYKRLSSTVSVMGIVNVTPDSFSDGGRYLSPTIAFDLAKSLVEEGATIIDIGGESTRPGAEAVTLQEELDRTMPVLEKITRELECLISIDTYKSQVAFEALRLGAHIVNDISGATYDEGMFRVVKEADAGLIIMHILGTPKSMQRDPQYKDVVEEVYAFLKSRCTDAADYGIDRVFIDPGLGFGKRQHDNYVLLKSLGRFRDLAKPIAVGTSRKSFLGMPFNAPPDDRLEGTVVSNVIAAANGANILRVHDVKSVSRALTIARLIAEA